MTTPLRVAKVANARARIAEVLTGRCPFPEETARELIDELLGLGWCWPGWQVDDHVPQPSSSTPEGRAAARALYEHVRRNKTEESAT